MTNNNLNQIRQYSAKFRYLCGILIFFIPLATLLYWLSINYLPIGFTKELPVEVTQTLPLSALLLAFAASMIPGSVAIYVVFTLKKLFSLYEKGIIFSIDNVRLFRKLGYALMIWVLSNFIFTPLLSVILTFNNSSGQRALVLKLGSADMTMLLIGAIVVIISWVMNEASKLEDERAHTV